MTKCFNCGDDHFAKDSKTQKIKQTPPSDQTIHMTIGTNAHIPIEMWQGIDKQLEELKLRNRKIVICKNNSLTPGSFKKPKPQ